MRVECSKTSFGCVCAGKEKIEQRECSLHTSLFLPVPHLPRHLHANAISHFNICLSILQLHFNNTNTFGLSVRRSLLVFIAMCTFCFGMASELNAGDTHSNLLPEDNDDCF